VHISGFFLKISKSDGRVSSKMAIFSCFQEFRSQELIWLTAAEVDSILSRYRFYEREIYVRLFLPGIALPLSSVLAVNSNPWTIEVIPQLEPNQQIENSLSWLLLPSLAVGCGRLYMSHNCFDQDRQSESRF
jgi:hypothetical protein